MALIGLSTVGSYRKKIKVKLRNKETKHPNETNHDVVCGVVLLSSQLFFLKPN